MIEHFLRKSDVLQLQEANIGSLLPRHLCGQAYTLILSQEPASDGSGNIYYKPNSFPAIITEGQICVAPGPDLEAEAFINSTAEALANVSLYRTSQRCGEGVCIGL